jgi:hypothetical protein
VAGITPGADAGRGDPSIMTAPDAVEIERKFDVGEVTE